ncbi:hypothetical protein CJ030_MR0G007027 [Morella rubra]|uniref:Uncharacterized protein n=1 Tax=Morella rubra TaxID=262757 RepID=A0A6A1UK05_9ROSI|nr:hypothetical protein CJ030_MR0G007027 [Morella rubra]
MPSGPSPVQPRAYQGIIALLYRTGKIIQEAIAVKPKLWTKKLIAIFSSLSLHLVVADVN